MDKVKSLVAGVVLPDKIDEADGTTVLDYTRKEIVRNKGNANESILREYYDVLRKAGAKHKTEL